MAIALCDSSALESASFEEARDWVRLGGPGRLNTRGALVLSQREKIAQGDGRLCDRIMKGGDRSL